MRIELHRVRVVLLRVLLQVTLLECGEEARDIGCAVVGAVRCIGGAGGVVSFREPPDDDHSDQRDYDRVDGEGLPGH